MISFTKHIELFWRHKVLYPFLRNVLHNPPFNGYLDIRNTQKILFLRFDRIGDMIVTTPFFSYFKKYFPHMHIGVVASEKNVELLRYNKNVDVLYCLSPQWWHNMREIRKIQKENYDVVLNLIFNRTTTVGLFSYYVAPHAIKVGQGNEKHRFYFNKFLQLPRNTCHMTETIARYCKEVFGITIPESELEYSLPIDNQTAANVLKFLRSFFEKKDGERFRCVAVNLSAVDADRRISTQQASAILRTLQQRGIPSVVLRGPGDREMDVFARKEESKGLCKIFPPNREATLLELAALVGNVQGVITPDTSLVHFAAATKTPVLAFYTQRQEWREWQPWRVPHISVLGGHSEPVSALSLTQITEAVEKFLEIREKRNQP